MRKSILLAQHLAMSSGILLVLVVFAFLSFYPIQNILNDPSKYFDTDLSGPELQFILVRLLLITTAVLISYIVYLILTLSTRSELITLRATRSLNLQLEQFTRLYEEAPIPYMMLNSDGAIYRPNKAALRFFDAALGEIEGKNLFYYQPEEDKENADKLNSYYKSNIPIDREEIRLITKDGQTKWALLSIFEIGQLEIPNRVGLATIVDITDQKKLDQAKTEFLSLTSHQLRTPVATVKWYMEMLLSGDMGDLEAKQRDYMERIYKVNGGMIELIENLLNVSRIEIGSLAVEMAKTDVPELVESVLVELSSQIEEKGITINKQYRDDLKNIESDPRLLRIVIQNLVSNAVKYTPKGGSVTITLKDSFSEKSITVSDTGIGIPESQKSKIFSKLFRADNAKMSGSQGTGIGLYLVKSIMKSLDGSVTFDSEENKGATFKIKL